MNLEFEIKFCQDGTSHISKKKKKKIKFLIQL
jgi:hypothetical protein